MENPIDRIRRLLLEDVKTGSLSWFYISVADTEFRGGYVIQARGPTEAWTLFHRLDWGYKGANTITCPIPEEQMVNIPASMRWRKLTKDYVREELDNLLIVDHDGVDLKIIEVKEP
jgi:hypothetical protein